MTVWIHPWGTGADGDLALGGFCDLTSQGKAWCGERFDVETEIMRCRVRRQEACE